MLLVGLLCAASMLALSVGSVGYVAAKKRQRGISLAVAIVLIAINGAGLASVIWVLVA